MSINTRPIYDLTMTIAARCAGAASRLWTRNTGSKTARFLRAQRDPIGPASRACASDGGGRRVWIHCASLGEFAIARPIIASLRKDPTVNVVITFFSPSGYEVVSRKKDLYPEVYYLPLDSPGNVRKFIDCIRPDAAVFMVSEFWHNYLSELKRREIPVFLVSALIRRGSVFFKWYGTDYRADLRCYRRIFPLDESSRELLAGLGVMTAECAGDPLYDNALAIAEKPYSNPIIEKFRGNSFLLIAGSLNDEHDLELVAAVANKHPEQKFLIVPHDVGSNHIERIVRAIKKRTIRYSNCSESTDFSAIQCLVIDYVGELASIYRYGDCAYIGGGFTPYLHSLVEAAVYGLPVAFGPRIERKISPAQLMEAGVGTMVSTPEELISWYDSLLANAALCDSIKEKARKFVDRNSGATEKIAGSILASLPHNSATKQ